MMIRMSHGMILRRISPFSFSVERERERERERGEEGNVLF